MKQNECIIFGLSASKELTNSVCKKLGVEPGIVNISRFADGEILTENKTSVRGKTVFVIQSTSAPANENLMELLIFIDSLKRGSVKEINIIMPYYGYARQDRKARGRQPITARLVADLLEVAGVHRIITFDIHSPQIQGFFNVPVDNLKSSFLMFNELNKRNLKDIMVVSPDHGGIGRARELATFLHGDLAIIDKRRPKANQSKVMNILGDVKDKNCLIVDDMIDTGGTIMNAAKAIKAKGAKSVRIVCTHAVFSNDAVSNLQDKDIDEVIVTDSISLPKEKQFKNLTILSLDDFIAKVIKSQTNETPVSDIYNEYYKEVVKKSN
jgi:ribose-phosphate pyrophosphokinase